MINIDFCSKSELYEKGAIAVFINDSLQIDSDIMEIDHKFHGVISKAINNEKKFKGEFGQVVNLSAIDKNGDFFDLIIVGVGKESKVKDYQLKELGGLVYRAASALKTTSVVVNLSSDIGDFNKNHVAYSVSCGAMLASYKFIKYFTDEKVKERYVTTELTAVVDDVELAHKEYESYKALAMGVHWARDLVSEVPNTLYPQSYAEEIVTKLEPLGVDVTVIGEREMKDLGMGALLGVGQGSAKESQMVVMQYHGGGDENPVCFVGKGVTFDTGGISLKPSANMGDMKYDMGGSAAVVGAMKALALRKAKANVIGIVGLVENMPGGNAQRPGDVVTTMSGKTVEVLNTDAEGRLVLCDCVSYLQKYFKPECVIDLATLTGAILISLASSYAGLFANDDELANKLLKASDDSNERLWRMPLDKDFDDMINSTVADVANLGGERGMAGSSTAAHFIGRFIDEGVKWAHLDIAGMAWEKKGKNPVNPLGAVGFGVRLLDQFVKDNYESN